MEEKKSNTCIVIAENAPIISTGFAHTLTRLPGISVRAVEITSRQDLYLCLRRQSPSILVINPHYDATLNFDSIRKDFPDLKIVAIEITPLDQQTRSKFDDSIGINDDPDTIASKIRKVSEISIPGSSSKEPISVREKEIIKLVVKGHTNKEIADILFLSIHTVLTHRRNIARKLEIHSPTGLTIYAIVNKLVDISDLHL